MPASPGRRGGGSSRWSTGAPALGFLRSAKAQIAAARGWPRLADEESHIAATLAPPDRSTEIALAEAALSRKRFDEAESRSAALVTLYPEDQASGAAAPGGARA